MPQRVHIEKGYFERPYVVAGVAGAAIVALLLLTRGRGPKKL